MNSENNVPRSSSNTAASLKHAATALTAIIMAGGVTAHAAAADDLAEANTSAATELPGVEVQALRNKAVSSPKFTAALVDTPQTISVIPKEIFNEQGAASLADVLANTPGITFLAGEGGHVSGSNSFYMRGFDTSGNIYIDGVRDSGNYGRDIYTLEQVEVVKGPAGDNGRGAASGYINLSTKAPRMENFSNGTASYGFDEYASIDRKRATIDLNRSFDEKLKGVAFRLNGLWQDGGVAGRDYAEKNTWGIAPSLAFGLGTSTRAIVTYQHDEQNDRPEYGTIGGIVDGTATASRPLNKVDRSRFYGLLVDFDDVTIDIASLRLEHDFTPTLRLTNFTRYSETDRKAIYTVPGGLNNAPEQGTGNIIEIVTANRQAFARKIETLTNQTNLASQFSTGSIDHSFAGGLELIREEGKTLRDWTGLGTATDLSKVVSATSTIVGTSPYQPNPARPLVGYAPTYAFIDDIRIDTAALYAYDTAKLNDQWQLTGGVRLETYEAKYNVLERATGITTRSTFEDTIATGKVGVVYKPAANASIYASWGLAAQPPGTNNLSNDNGSRNNGTPPTTGQNSPNADPQESYNYEVGTKWDFFQRRLSTSVALFRSERTNISVATDTNGVPTLYGDQTVQGVEFSISGRVTADWMVFGGLSYLDSENKNSANAVQDGSNVNWTPEWSGNLWTTYRLPFGLTLGGGTQYTGQSRVSLNSTSAGVLPSHWIGNLMASYEINKNVSVRFNVNNVTDELYARAINNNSNRTYLGDPRTFLVSADFKF